MDLLLKLRAMQFDHSSTIVTIVTMIKSVDKVRKSLAAPLLAVVALIFCTAPTTAMAENNLRSVLIQSLLDFNAILITEVDVVFVYDDAMAAQMPVTKGEWYSQKYDLLKDDPAEVDVITTSIPQGFDSVTLSLPENSATAIKVFAVAYHEGQGVAIHDMTDMERSLIQIDQFGIRVSARN